MLRKYVQLLAPAPAIEVESGGGAAPAATAKERPMSGWMKSIGDIGQPAAESKKEEPNASPNDTTGRPAVGEPAGKQPVADDAAAKAKEAAESKRLEDEKAAAKTAKPGDKAEPADDGDEKWPRSSGDWDKFKAKRKERESALRKEIETRDARLKEVEGKIADYETKLKATPTVDPKIQGENEQLRSMNKELTDRITVLDVTQHPQFVSYFENQIKAAHEDAAAILGKENGEKFVELIKLPDSEWKKGEMETFYAGLTDVEKSEIGTVTHKLRAIERERQDAIKQAGEHKDQMTATGAAKAKASLEQRTKALEALFTQGVKTVQDPQTGVPAFQLREGDDAWNAEVAARIESVKSLLTSNGVKPETIVRGAFNAVALPAFLKVYADEKKAWTAEREKLEAQVKALSAAQPGEGGTGADKIVDKRLPADTDPHARTQKWAKDMVNQLNAVGQ